MLEYSTKKPNEISISALYSLYDEGSRCIIILVIIAMLFLM